MRYDPSQKSPQHGFTLIEMLVVVTISMLMLGGGLAAYMRFNEKQEVQEAAKTLQVQLRSAQKKARAGDKPTGCDKLLEYEVSMANGSSQMVDRARCQNGDIIINTDNLPTTITSPTAFRIRFRVLHGGASFNGGTGIITLVSGTYQYQFQVKEGGEITVGGFL